KQKLGTYIGGTKVLGNRNQIREIVKEKKIDEIIIAIAHLDKRNKREVIEGCKEASVKVSIMPGLSEIIDGHFSINKIREVDVKDLLGREEVNLDYTGIADYIKYKVVLVTGGGGSIGSELCRQIIRFNPKELIILDIYENNAYDIQNELKRAYPELKLRTLIASVRDRKRLKSIFEELKPHVVFHAAAHKHVPLMEDSPMEAIKNNVLGTLNVAEMASAYEVEKFVLISTDKAVNPTNVMGATKRLCEMIIQGINRESKTEFVAVRFGNVLGSNGSVIPLFKKQIAEGGPITLTHKDITRYFMLIPEAAQLVLQAGAYAKGGEIFVLDMGSPVKIYDLACDLIKLSGLELGKDINIEITGLRPGEKLYEELLMSEEGLSETMHEKIFIGAPGEFKLDDVKHNINELIRVAEKNKGEKLRDKLGEVVPTYKITEEDRARSEVAATKK
ncbi:MAG: polysaccharide biosynthesis protein, partial [Clostridium sp.]